MAPPIHNMPRSRHQNSLTRAARLGAHGALALGTVMTSLVGFGYVRGAYAQVTPSGALSSSSNTSTITITGPGTFETQDPLLTATMSRQPVTVRSLNEIGRDDLRYYGTVPAITQVALAPVSRPNSSDSVFLLADATAEVTVPSDYNYYIDGVLRKDGVIVDTVRTTVNLDPSEQLSVNETRRDVDLEVSEFERERRAETGDGAEMAGESDSATPGFGIPVAALALLLGGLFARRRLS